MKVRWLKENGGKLDAIVPIKKLFRVTFYPMIKTLNDHEDISRVFICIDPRMSGEDVAYLENMRNMFPSKIRLVPGEVGKGQNVLAAMTVASSSRILFCDADYIGLRADHISLLTRIESGMVVGVPVYPYDVPEHVLRSWAYVSGFRSVPRPMVPRDLHGYLMEYQLNKAARDSGQIVSHIYMWGLRSPFKWPLEKDRFEDLINDRLWGREHGIFPEIVTGSDDVQDM